VDLQLYFRVIWRFRIVVLAGLTLALLLAFLSFYRVSFRDGTPKINHRQSESFQSTEKLLLTTRGGAYYRIGSPALAGVFGQVAMNYAEIANGDAVRRIMLEDGPINGLVTASPGVDQITHRIPLPLVDISGVATNPQTAVSLASRASNAFRRYVDVQQETEGVPVGQRIKLQVLSSASAPQLVAARRKTVPIVVLLTTIIATLGLVFILENLRPRVAPVRIRQDEDQRERRIGRGA
jgi:hypothetical protein